MPQLVNVLRGDINLVGIRPLLDEALREQAAAETDIFDTWYECYQLSPGLTGEGQLYSKQFPEHTSVVLRRRMELDIDRFYNASLINDMRTVARTPFKLLRAALGTGTPDPLEQPQERPVASTA